jgi:cellulose biosynthesis protein BcsQ
MNTIATINFKGGVGKTTATWALGNVAAQTPGVRSLVCDLDAHNYIVDRVKTLERAKARYEVHRQILADLGFIHSDMDAIL